MNILEKEKEGVPAQRSVCPARPGNEREAPALPGTISECHEKWTAVGEPPQAKVRSTGEPFLKQGQLATSTCVKSYFCPLANQSWLGKA